MSVKSYQQLPRLPPPPPSPRAKPALKKTVSAPHAALSRLLGSSSGSRGPPDEGRGDGEGDGGGGRGSGKRRSKNKRPIEIGEDVLASETPPSASPPLPPAIPEGNLIDLDTDDASSTSDSPSATSLSSYPPSFRCGSVGNGDRPSPQPKRRPPPPPPQRTRLATVSGALSTEKSSPAVKRRPTPPPKPSYLSSSPPPEQESGQTSVPVSDSNGVGVTTKPEAKPRSSGAAAGAQVPSPYITFTPLRKPEPPPRVNQDTPISNDSPSPNSSPTKSTAPNQPQVPSSPKDKTTPPATSAPPTHPVTFPNPPPREMEYTEREHPRNVFEYLNKMRQRGDLCDVTLVGSTREFRAHKAVLAACSQYFESMFIGEFAEPDGEPIIVEEIEDDALEALVTFAYTSRIKLTNRNIYLIFAAADLLQFSGVRGACFKFFKQQMNKSNCIRTWLFGDGHNCTELIDAALRYIESNFLDVVRGREFLSLEQVDVVVRLLGLEDIAVTTEEQVYEAALKWLRHDLESRRSDAVEVMKSIRFPNMSRDTLLNIVETEDIIKENPQCLQMLIEALESFVSGTRTRLRKMMMKKREKESLTYVNVKPRNASMAVETVEFCRDDDSLGLRIMGGSERPFHVFRQGDKPGIFILMVTPSGVAAKTGKLRTGDRILKVNGADVSTATHDQAIRLLKTSPDPLSLFVRHEPAPPGLQELTLVTKPGEGFGLSLSGGVNGYHGNPLDETDEGLFISQVIPGGAAESDGRLKEGTRILQVNSISMLGKTLAEAIRVFQGVLDRINLLVCSGYDPSNKAVISWQTSGGGGRGVVVEAVDESGSVVGGNSLYDWRTPACDGGGSSNDGVLV